MPRGPGMLRDVRWAKEITGIKKRRIGNIFLIIGLGNSIAENIMKSGILKGHCPVHDQAMPGDRSTTSFTASFCR